jgi:ABC-type glycerol-3-phosphate transport system substrate-binding protein
MEPMKKVSRWFAVLFLALFFQAGCAKGPKIVRVAVFTTDPVLIKILIQTAQDIEKRYPGMKIKMDNIPYTSFQDKITTLIAAGSAPDVVSVEVSNFADLYLRGVFEELQPYVDKDGLDMKAYYPTVVKRFSPGGKLYAIPSDTAPFGLMYYNKKLFKEAGIPFPKAEWKWPEPFLSICRKLTKKNDKGRIVQWAYADPYGFGFDNYMFSNGGYYLDSEENPTRMVLDSPVNMEAIHFAWDLIHTYHVSPTATERQNYSMGGVGGENMFYNGVVAMMSSGIWHTPHFLQNKDLDFDVVEFPQGPKGARGWGTGGSGYAMTKGCKNKDQAWIVIKEFTSAAVLTQVASTGMIQPALIKVAESDVFLKAPGPANKGILLKMPENAHYGPFIKNWPEIWNSVAASRMDKMWLGGKTPDEVIPPMVKDINKKFFGIEDSAPKPAK